MLTLTPAFQFVPTVAGNLGGNLLFRTEEEKFSKQKLCVCARSGEWGRLALYFVCVVIYVTPTCFTCLRKRKSRAEDTALSIWIGNKAHHSLALPLLLIHHGRLLCTQIHFSLKHDPNFSPSRPPALL